MLTQKLYKNGNSLVVTIPKEVLKELNIRDGSLVEIHKHSEGVLISPAKKSGSKGVDVKFMQMVEEFLDEHEDVLKELSKR